MRDVKGDKKQVAKKVDVDTIIETVARRFGPDLQLVVNIKKCCNHYMQSLGQATKACV